MSGQLVGPAVEFAVGKSLGAAADRHRVGGQPGLLLDQLVNAEVRGKGFVGGVGGHQQRFALGLGEQVQARDGTVGIAGCGVQQPEVVAGQTLHARAVEQIGVEGHGPGRPGRPVGHHQAQVDLGRAVVDVDLFDLRPHQPEGGGRVGQAGEHHLEQRVAVETACRPQLLHQPFERHVLVRVGVHGGPADPIEQLGEARVAREVGADDHGVDERAHQRVEFRTGPARDRCADRHVGLPAAAGEQGLERGEQRHEHRRAVPPAQQPQPPGQFLGHREGDPLALARADRSARTVGGQVQRRQPGQLRAPVVQLALQTFAGEPGPLPMGEVRVLDPQGGQLVLATFQPAPVHHRQVVPQQRHRPAVDRDVVDDHHQDVFVLVDPQQ